LIEVNSGDETTIIHATGGGAYKYQDLFEKEFDG
jgi:pantothenate kinase